MSPHNFFIRIFSNYIFNRRVLPYWVIFLADIFIVFLSAIFVYWIANNTISIYTNRLAVFVSAAIFAVISLVGARIFRTYSGILRYSSFVDLMRVVYANFISLAISLAVLLIAKWQHWILFSDFTVLDVVCTFFLATTLMWAMRVLVKLLFDAVNSDSHAIPVLIYGALTGGVGLAKDIRSQNPVKYVLRGFISHDKRIKNMKLMGVKVYSLDDDFAEVVRRYKIKAVLVSPLKTEAFRQNQRIQDILIGLGCKILMVPHEYEAEVKNGTITDGEFGRIELREVCVEDLLPRSEIKVDLESVAKLLAGKTVLITGSAGSIGKEIVRQVAKFNPSRMVLIDQAETPQHDVRLMMAKDFPDVNNEVIVTSIDRKTRMEHIFSEYRPDYVFHAAAYKHVPMMEDNPSEAVLNNIQGTRILADLSVKYGVKKFVMISTDKAVNPTNVMGCSKRICEIYVQSLDRLLKMKAMQSGIGTEYTQFVTTRFGNVLGSNGSVIPLFRQQIKAGGPVTVTDERVVRFFMLIPEACKLVLEAGTMGNGGEIFVFDMGEPVKISDLAKRMIALSNAKNVEIKYIGLREGEKLYEEVLNEMEGTKPTFHEKIRIAQVREYDYEEVSRQLDELVSVAKTFDNMETVRRMKQIVPEYKSNNSVYEILDKEQATV